MQKQTKNNYKKTPRTTFFKEKLAESNTYCQTINKMIRLKTEKLGTKTIYDENM